MKRKITKNCSTCRYNTPLTRCEDVVLCSNKHAEKYGEEVPIEFICELYMHDAQSTIYNLEDLERSSTGKSRMVKSEQFTKSA